MSPKPKAQSPSKKKTMDFPDAMRELIAGKKVRRVEWPEGELGFTKDGRLMIRREGVEYQWTLTDGDWLSNDWAVIS